MKPPGLWFVQQPSAAPSRFTPAAGSLEAPPRGRAGHVSPVWPPRTGCISTSGLRGPRSPPRVTGELGVVGEVAGEAHGCRLGHGSTPSCCLAGRSACLGTGGRWTPWHGDAVTEVLYDAEGPAGSLSVTYLHRCDEYSVPSSAGRLRTPRAGSWKPASFTSTRVRPIRARPWGASLPNSSTLPVRQGTSSMAIFGRPATSHCSAMTSDPSRILNLELLDQAAEKFNSRDVGQYF